MVSKDKTEGQNNTSMIGLSMPPIELELSHENNQRQTSQLVNSYSFVPPPGGERKCCHCKELLPSNQFNKDRSKKSGLQSKCRRCSNSCVESWRTKNASLRAAKSAPPKRPRRVKSTSKNRIVRSYDTQRREEERAVQDEGLNIRNRRHVSTKQRYRSRLALQKGDHLERLANEILKTNPRSK